jgi:hypothetical protein
VLVFGRSLGLSSQTFVMQFKNLPIAHLGYFRTDFKTGRPYALFLIRDPVLPPELGACLPNPPRWPLARLGC